MPLLRTLMRPPEDSPLGAVPVDAVASYLVYLLSSRVVKEAGAPTGVGDISACDRHHFHEDFGFGIGVELLADPDTPHTRALCKTLSLLQLEGATLGGIKRLRALAAMLSAAVEEAGDKIATRSVEKWCASLMTLDPAPETAVDDDVLCALRGAVESRRNELANTAMDDDGVDSPCPKCPLCVPCLFFPCCIGLIF